MNRKCNIEVVERVALRSYRCWELCLMYEVSKKTFLRWIEPFLDEIGKRRGHFYTIAQVQTIFLKLGIPGKALND